MSDTPRTDALVATFKTEGNEFAWVEDLKDLCRELERSARPEALQKTASEIDEYANHLATLAGYVEDVGSWHGAFQGLRKFVALKLKNAAESPLRQKP